MKTNSDLTYNVVCDTPNGPSDVVDFLNNSAHIQLERGVGVLRRRRAGVAGTRAGHFPFLDAVPSRCRLRDRRPGRWRRKTVGPVDVALLPGAHAPLAWRDLLQQYRVLRFARVGTLVWQTETNRRFTPQLITARKSPHCSAIAAYDLLP